MIQFSIRYICAMLAVSYLTVGALNPEQAQHVWWMYAAVVLTLTTIDLVFDAWSSAKQKSEERMHHASDA